MGFKFLHRSAAGLPGCKLQYFVNTEALHAWFEENTDYMLCELFPVRGDNFFAIVTKQLSDEEIEELQEVQEEVSARLAERKQERELRKREQMADALAKKAETLAALDVGRQRIKTHEQSKKEYLSLTQKHFTRLLKDADLPIPETPDDEAQA